MPIPADVSGTPSLADLTALEDWLGQSIADDDVARADAVLAAASALVRAEAGTTWLDDDGALSTVPDEVAVVTVQVAARVWRNPSGVIQESVGPFTTRYAEAVSDGLYLTASERSVLSRYRTTGARQLWTQATTRRLVPDEDGWVPVVGTENLFPWYDA